MCYNPIAVSNPLKSKLFADIKFREENGSPVPMALRLLYDKTPSFLYVPCRRCIDCLKARSAEWSSRLRSELDYFLNTLKKPCYFVTLTVAPEYYHLFNCDPQCYRSVFGGIMSTFFRKLKDRYGCSFRHFCIFERGDKRGRLHVHCLFFDPPVSLDTDGVHRYVRRGVESGSSPVLREFWPYGFNDSSRVQSVGAGCYVAKYVTKCDFADMPMPIFTSNNMGKTPEVLELSRAVLDNCLSSGIYDIPVAYGRTSLCYCMPYKEVMRKSGQRYKRYYQDIDSAYLIDLFLIHARDEFYARRRLGSGVSYTSPEARRLYFERITGIDLRYRDYWNETLTRWRSLLDASGDFGIEGFYEELDFLIPF